MPRYTIGIDEVGRGPLAGPVVVCALALPHRMRLTGAGMPAPLRDSKKLTKLQRECWYQWITTHPQISFAVSRVYPRGIERLNISRAANLAATRAVSKLATSVLGMGDEIKVFLDGGLYLNSLKPITYNLSPKTIVRGDEKIKSVMLASIIAKVTRDSAMVRLHKKYPQYGFDKHKGYGTRAHFAALKIFGPSPAHRKTFLAD